MTGDDSDAEDKAIARELIEVARRGLKRLDVANSKMGYLKLPFLTDVSAAYSAGGRMKGVPGPSRSLI